MAALISASMRSLKLIDFYLALPDIKNLEYAPILNFFYSIFPVYCLLVAFLSH
jgi:hypothetical protein